MVLKKAFIVLCFLWASITAECANKFENIKRRRLLSANNGMPVYIIDEQLGSHRIEVPWRGKISNLFTLIPAEYKLYLGDQPLKRTDDKTLMADVGISSETRLNLKKIPDDLKILFEMISGRYKYRILGATNYDQFVQRIITDGFPQADNFECQCNEHAKITKLVVPSKFVGDLNLEKLSKLTSLTHLELTDYGLDLSDISQLSKLQSLTYLDLGNNKISNIKPLSTLISLTGLNLRNNEISDVTALIGLVSLKDLWLSNNLITNVASLSQLRSLKHLDLSCNTISNLPELSDLRERGTSILVDADRKTKATRPRRDAFKGDVTKSHNMCY